MDYDNGGDVVESKEERISSSMKFDPHTHVFEYLRQRPNSGNVKLIIDTAKRKGLGALAVTEHDNKEIGFEASRLASVHFPDFRIIPGVETSREGVHVITLFLPEGEFELIAHSTRYIEGVQGIEIKNAQYPELDEVEARRIAKEHDLVMLESSDAHDINRIGFYFSNLEEIVNCVITRP